MNSSAELGEEQGEPDQGSRDSAREAAGGPPRGRKLLPRLRRPLRGDARRGRHAPGDDPTRNVASPRAHCSTSRTPFRPRGTGGQAWRRAARRG